MTDVSLHRDTVLVVDDQPESLLMLTDTLESSAISVLVATSGQGALDLMGHLVPDLVLMDAALPGQRGEDVVRQARAAGLTTPLILLTADSAPAGRTKALDQGADDVVTTPCDIEELLARIRAVVRRSAGHARSVIQAGCVELSLDKREVVVGGKKLRVSPREYGVLELLFLKQGTVLNKAAFLHHLYTGADEPELKAVDVIVCRLRKKLERHGVGSLVDTVRGVGYILRAPVAPGPNPELPLVA